MQDAEVIVLGVGAMGSAALSALARRGVDAIGLEQFGAGHDRGSSHGESRLIRKAYFEHPDYVPLLDACYRRWHDLEARSGQHLFDDGIGLVMMGDAHAPAIAGTLEAARRHHLPIEEVSAGEARARWPQLAVSENHTVIFDPQGGLLRVEACVRAHIEDACAHGARFLSGHPALQWRADPRGVAVDTADRTWRASRLIIAGGAWSSTLLAELGLPLEVRRKIVAWFAPRTEAFGLGHLPAFVYDLGPRFIYGFPGLGQGVKIGDHRGGQRLAQPSPSPEPLAGDLEPVIEFVAHLLRDLEPNPIRHAVCMYTLTPDEHFIVDRHPRHPNVVFAAGMSGHGFKFSPMVGEALADLVLNGRSALPLGLFAAERFPRN